MTPHELPELLQRAMAIVFVGIGIGLVVAHTLLVTFAAQRSTLAPRKRLVLAGGVGAYLIAWLAVAITFGDRNNFPLEREHLRSRSASSWHSAHSSWESLVCSCGSRYAR